LDEKIRQNKRKNTAQHGQRARLKTKISTEANTLHQERQTMCGEDQKEREYSQGEYSAEMQAPRL